MARRKDGISRRSRSRKYEKLQAIYAESRKAFGAADLQKYTVIEKGIPLEKVIAEMEEIQRNSKPNKA